MKKCLPVLALLLTAGTVPAQITVTSATFPVAGDTLWFAIDNSPGTIGSLTPPGPQDWDFTGLTKESTYNTVYRPANGGTVSAQLPDAELFAAGPFGTETYYNVTGTKFEQLAYYGIVPYDLVANNIFDYAPPLTERWAPLNFFDINASASGFLELFLPSDFSPVLILQLAAQTNNAQIDSMRYRVAISETAAVDAYGKLSIPSGTFDVLREKRTKYTETRIDCKIPPLGWLDLTDQCIQAGFFGLGVDTTYAYHFFNDVAKEPIAVVTLDNNQAFATQIVFKNTAPPIINSVGDKSRAVPTVSISPNPASDEVVFELKNLLPGSYRMAIFDETGRVVFEKIAQLNTQQTEQIGLSQHGPGVYFFNLFDENGRMLCGEKLVKK